LLYNQGLGKGCQDKSKNHPVTFFEESKCEGTARAF